MERQCVYLHSLTKYNNMSKKRTALRRKRHVYIICKISGDFKFICMLELMHDWFVCTWVYVYVCIDCRSVWIGFYMDWIHFICNNYPVSSVMSWSVKRFYANCSNIRYIDPIILYYGLPYYLELHWGNKQSFGTWSKYVQPSVNIPVLLISHNSLCHKQHKTSKLWNKRVKQ